MVYCPTRCFGSRLARSTDPGAGKYTANSPRVKELSGTRLCFIPTCQHPILSFGLIGKQSCEMLASRQDSKQNKSDHELDMVSFLSFTQALRRLRQQDCK